MPYRGCAIQPYRRWLLAGNDHVYVMAASKAMVSYRKKRVGVGRQIDTYDIGLLVYNVIDKPGVLMRKSIVILPPNVRRQQIVQRREGCSPRQGSRDLQPLRVLIKHGIHDVDEAFVAVKETVPSC